MSKTGSSSKRSLLPTVTMAVGVLLGGLLGAVVGAQATDELFTIASYVVGFLGGASAGSMLGLRWEARREHGVQRPN